MSIATHKHCAEQNVSLVTHSMPYNATGNVYRYCVPLMCTANVCRYCVLNTGFGVREMERTLRKLEKYQECVQDFGGKY